MCSSFPKLRRTAAYPQFQASTFLAEPLLRNSHQQSQRCARCYCSLLSRRAALQILGAVLAAATGKIHAASAFSFWPFQNSNQGQRTTNPNQGLAAQEGYTVFEVKGSDEADVTLEPMTNLEALDDLVTCDAVFLGEKHNSLADHYLQARIIEGLWQRRGKTKNGKSSIAVGVEQVQKKYQDVLDMYIAKKIGEEDLFYMTEWETRWVWPFERYLPIFRMCRKLQVPMIAMSLENEIVKKVQKGGLEVLARSELREYIPHPEAFATISREAAFKAYVDKSIIPSYSSHVRLGVLGSKPTFNLFYTTRVLRDEVMAGTAADFIEHNPGTLFVGLVGSDHVKFSYGVPLRVERQIIAGQTEADDESPRTKAGSPKIFRKPKIKSVMLNPTPNDAMNPKDNSLMLELPVSDRHRKRSSGNGSSDMLLISNLLWFSSADSAHPRRRAFVPRSPPVEELIFPGIVD